jgi:CheY-like chemotaxis protein
MLRLRPSLWWKMTNRCGELSQWDSGSEVSSVIEASDGSIALDLLHAHRDEIDVVLLDVTLPGASSREVFEEALRIRPDMKVIVTSAYGEEVVDAHYSGLRVDHFIRKPFQLDHLVRLFGSVLSAKAH